MHVSTSHVYLPILGLSRNPSWYTSKPPQLLQVLLVPHPGQLPWSQVPGQERPPDRLTTVEAHIVWSTNNQQKLRCCSEMFQQKMGLNLQILRIFFGKNVDLTWQRGDLTKQRCKETEKFWIYKIRGIWSGHQTCCTKIRNEFQCGSFPRSTQYRCRLLAAFRHVSTQRLVGGGLHSIYLRWFWRMGEPTLLAVAQWAQGRFQDIGASKVGIRRSLDTHWTTGQWFKSHWRYWSIRIIPCKDGRRWNTRNMRK